MQKYSRKKQIPIDQLGFNFKVIEDSKSDIQASPEIGCLVDGLYLEGARWNSISHSLDESFPKKIYSEMKIVFLN